MQLKLASPGEKGSCNPQWWHIRRVGEKLEMLTWVVVIEYLGKLRIEDREEYTTVLHLNQNFCLQSLLF